MGPGGTGSFRRGLVLGWNSQFLNSVLWKKKTKADVLMFQSEVTVPTLAYRQSSAWVLAAPSTTSYLPDTGEGHQTVRGPPQTADSDTGAWELSLESFSGTINTPRALGSRTEVESFKASPARMGVPCPARAGD